MWSSREWKTKPLGSRLNPIIVEGRPVNLWTQRWYKNTEANSSWIQRVEYVPLNPTKGFMITTLKTNPTYLYKGEIKQTRSKGGQLTYPIAFKKFMKVICDPANRPFAGVGTDIWSLELLRGAGEEIGGESEYQRDIVQTFKMQKQTSGKSYEQITSWIQEGRVDKLQRAINKQTLIKRKFSAEQLLVMFIRSLQF